MFFLFLLCIYLFLNVFIYALRCQDSVKHYCLEFDSYKNVYKFGIGQFDSLHEVIDHFRCMPVLGGETGNEVIYNPFRDHSSVT